MCGERNNVENPHMQSIHVSMLNLELRVKILYLMAANGYSTKGWARLD
jgi:hypothetical protein